MLHRSTLDKASRPGLRFQGWKALPLGSKIAIVVLCLIALIAILAPVVAPYSPGATGLAEAKTTSYIEGVGEVTSSDPVVAPSMSHLFGTDGTGRDIFSRAVYGARVSLVVGLTATGLALLVASVLGAVAATSRKWIAETLMRVLDVVMSFPGIALAAVLVSAMSTRLPMLPVIIISIAVLYIPQLTRVVRANIISQFGEDYVAASKVMGAPVPWILLKHVARNCIAPIMVFATVLVADAIVFEASLSFIGAGIKSVNTPTWGNMLSEGKELLLSGHWWPTFFPGLLILITTLCLNVLSEGLTDAMASPHIKAKPDVQADEEAMEAQETLDAWDDAADAVTANSAAVKEDGATNVSSLTGVVAPAAEDVPLADRLSSLRVAELARRDRLVYEDSGEDPVLEVKNLSIAFPEQHGEVNIVDGVSFSVRPGETMGLVGESGCGKSISSMAVMGLLPPSARLSGEILFKGRNILKMTPTEHNALRGHEMSMVYQDALSSLNPSMLIRTQMSQLTSRGGTRSAEDLLELVGLDPKRTLRSYPHELSGGQRQRVLIAMALTRDPSLVLADEPTTALDVTIQAQILDLIKDLQEEHKAGIILITHDLGVVAQVADRVAVMYAGQIVELATVQELFTHPLHPYTRSLLKSIPQADKDDDMLHVIKGMVPSLKKLKHTGCRFADRIPWIPAEEHEESPVLHEVSPGHFVRCSCWKNFRFEGEV